MDTVFTIEFLSEEWIRNAFITGFFMILYFYIASITKQENLIKFLKISALIVIGMTLTNHLLLIANGSWKIKKDLPLHLCSISAIVCCVIFFVKKKQFLFEFLFYAGITGGLLSISTPQITLYNENYFFYVMFYFKHAAIIAIPIVLMYRIKMNLSKYSGLKIFLTLNVLLAIIMPLNALIGSNYFYVATPPKVNNPLIILGEGKILGLPDYVFYWEIILIIIVVLFYSIFKKRK